METSHAGGFDSQLLGASADDAIAALSQAGDRAVALVEAWVKQGNAVAVAAVADDGAGASRKAARRGINVLKARGIPVPEKSKVASLSSKAVAATTEAWMLSPDGAGSLVFILTSHTVISRYTAAVVFIHDGFGVLRVENAVFNHSQLKEAMSRLGWPGAPKLIPVPVEWARYRIAQARKRMAERRAVDPLGFTTALPLLEPVPAEAQPHPFEEEGLVLDDEDAKELAKSSAKLHLLPEFRSWFPPQEAIESMLVEVGKNFAAGSEPPADEVQKHLDAQILAATDRYFSPQLREQLVLLMKDAALSVLAREGEQAALEVAATLRAVEQAGLITDPPHEIPFLRGYFEKTVAWLLSRNNGRLSIPLSRPQEASADVAASSLGASEPEAVSDDVPAVEPVAPSSDASAPSGSGEGT